MAEVTLDRRELDSVLKWLAKAVPAGRWPDGGVRLRFERRHAYLDITDGQSWATWVLEGRGGGRAASTMVAPKDLGRLLRTALGAGGGGVEVALDGDGLTLSWDGTTVHPRIFPATDFPERPGLNGGLLKLESIDVGALRRVVVAASTDEKRPILCAVCLDGGVAVATDSYRLAAASLLATLDRAVFLPGRVVGLLPTDGVELQIGQDRVQWHDGPRTVDLPLTVGEFPNWRNFPYPNSRKGGTARFESAAMAGAVKRAAAVTEEGQPLRMIRQDGSTLQVVVSDYDGRERFRTTVPVDRLAESWPAVALNPRYVADALRVVSDDAVSLEAEDPVKPVLFRGRSDPEAAWYLLMPVRMH